MDVNRGRKQTQIHATSSGKILHLGLCAMIRGKMGAIGLEPTTSRMWTVQTVKRENRVSNVVLLEVVFFKVQRFLRDPWGLICNVIANQPMHTKSSIFLILQAVAIVSKRNTCHCPIKMFTNRNFWWKVPSGSILAFVWFLSLPVMPPARSRWTRRQGRSLPSHVSKILIHTPRRMDQQ